MTDEKTDNTDDGVISRVRKKCDDAWDYWSENYERGKEDRRFVTLDDAPWNEEDRKAREKDGIPTLTFNLLRTFCRQQINSARLNRQQIKAEPADDVADKEIAKILNGLIKDTEISSSADNAYDAAMEAMVYGGIGFIRVHVDYVSEDSFQQEPKIIPIHNSESVYIDPESKELDGSDARYAVVMSYLPKQEIISKYSEDACADFDHGEANSKWFNKAKEMVCIAECFEIKEEATELYLLVDGSTTFDKPDDETLIEDQRKTTKKTCWWYKLTGSKVLESREFVVPMIPIIPVYGDVTWDGEDRYVYSMIHFARDSQKLYNFWKSSEAQQIAEGLRKQFLISGRAAGEYEEWDNPNAYQALRYDDVDEAGQPIAPPQLLPALNALTGILNAAEGSKDSIAEMLNMQPAALGGDVNNQSGKAIGLLQQRADVAHFHLTDNLNKSLAQVGRILIACYQKLYTTQMVKRITGEDGMTDRVPLNMPPLQAGQDAKGSIIDDLLNNITVGRYDIRMTTGASYISQRQENKQWLRDLLQFMPQLSQVAPDLLLKAFDDGNMLNEIVERFKKTLPPNLLEDGQNGQMQQMAQQYEAQLQQMAQQLQAAMDESKFKQAEIQLKAEEIESKERMKAAELQNNIEVALIKGHDAEDLQKLKGEQEAFQAGIQASLPTDMQYQDDPPPQQMQQPEPPQDGGFFMSEQTPEEPNFALNDGQIENNAPQMAAMQQIAPDEFQG